MKYTVVGADKTTGNDRTVVITATGPDDAQEKARGMGLLINQVEARTTADDEMPSRGEVLGELEEAEYLNPKTPRVTLPRPPTVTYSRLTVAAGILVVASGISLAVGIIAFIAGLVGLLAGKDDAEFVVVFGVSSMFSAAIQYGLSGACEALRDIAINSWKRPNSTKPD